LVRSSIDGEVLPGVEVSFVFSKGIQVAGTTDESGALTVQSDSMRELQPFVVLFCHPDFYCGAIPAERTGFYDFRELRISLALYTVN
jgi:hypothetical protein